MHFAHLVHELGRVVLWPLNFLPGVARARTVPRAHRAHVREPRRLVSVGGSARVVQNLAVVDVVVHALQLLQLPVVDLPHALESDAEGPHHLPVTHDDDPLASTLPVQRVNHPVHPQAHVCQRFAARGREEESVPLPPPQLLCKFLPALCVAHQIENAQVAFPQKRLGVPGRIGQPQLSRCLHRPHVLGHVIAVKVGVDVAAQPLACLNCLLDAEVGQPPLRRVPLREEGIFVERVIPPQRAPVRDISLRLAVAHQHQLGHARWGHTHCV
mmetsp:Transcript_29165/g.68321  ORF Transcript_29165/g.68321 Transcript_29165/m.68321 type:complete len:270 (+) Transcript_29165:420-1229(+)